MLKALHLVTHFSFITALRGSKNPHYAMKNTAAYREFKCITSRPFGQDQA